MKVGVIKNQDFEITRKVVKDLLERWEEEWKVLKKKSERWRELY